MSASNGELNTTTAASTETVTVTIVGSNDAPVITGGSDAAALTETDTTLTTNGSITVTDLDINDTVTASVASVALGGTFTSSGSTLPSSLSASSNQALKTCLHSAPLVASQG